VVGIYGDPVEHTRSPVMHNAAFAALGLDYRYLAFHVAPVDLRAAIQAIRTLRLRGVNVTVPHKENAVRYLDSVSELASAIGAVNTIVNDDGRLHGDNTDVHGFVESLRAYKAYLRGRRAIVVGAGGASRAILCGLQRVGTKEVLVANRTKARARKLIAEIAAHAPPTQIVGLEALGAASTFEDVALVVNATSLGWSADPFPIMAATASDERCLFYDLAYGKPTDFLKQARRARRPQIDGGEMLILQGARSFNLWTRRRAPITAMRIAFYKKYQIDRLIGRG
jgi:shikimate dehydrogenase